ncbi:MAG: dTDP-glucose 4,6-dehydratase [Acidobacteriia bacterium]|nr:dTDP-glucose 4,6-dehydratase [Terriglobia bacterium]
MKILVTGGAGFIGSNFIRFMLESYTDTEIVNLDKLTYAGNLDNLRDLETHPHYTFVRGDICDRTLVEKLVSAGLDAVVNFAAETHVDRSIEDARSFIETNVLGTHCLLEAARGNKVARFLQISTDEVYGSLPDTGFFTEETSLRPNSPYAASKAASDLLVKAYVHTFAFPGIITRCSNNYGPYQFPEKFLPLMINNARQGKPLPVYGDGLYVRDWLFARDHCRAIDLVLRRGRAGEVYNIGGNNEWRNIDIAKLILRHLGQPESLLTFVKDRPGHDRRYAIDASKIFRELGWKPETPFEEGLRATIGWYLENKTWLDKVTSGEYRNYYERMYSNR